ncbi:hypothetical protein GGX14DRAFT_564879 [Mycena pura]|uniref:MULE transposase domain-containing protein n=1 Tax=Mycena pura TaxID=153505 RepID=A0AAD6YI70_9AGAR|nr:hypothetical protein GGX14DRAFT_564879 [Mycena pura]
MEQLASADWWELHRGVDYRHSYRRSPSSPTTIARSTNRKSLEAFQERGEKYQLLENILRKLHKNERFHSGAQPLASAAPKSAVTAAMDAAIAEYEARDDDLDEGGDVLQMHGPRLLCDIKRQAVDSATPTTLTIYCYVIFKIFPDRKKALTGFATCVRDTYDIHPEFAHTDKDVAEISALKMVFNAKTSQCWWHVDDAVKKRLANKKLATTPYNVVRARAQFTFIRADFFPLGQADPDERENPDDEDDDAPAHEPEPTINPSRLTFRLPASATTQPEPQPRVQDGPGPLTIRLPAPRPATAELPPRVFCPEECRGPILQMMQCHSCAHPLIPGYSIPTAEGIKYWAVKQIFDFCLEHDLREAWAYLWENWYRDGEWQRWTRSSHAAIPRLRTTMICESHWRHIKHDFLHQFHSPRVDLLIWILVKKLAPTYYRKLELFLQNATRYRELTVKRQLCVHRVKQ